MNAYRVQAGAGERIDEIYLYTRDTWGEAQAHRYIRGLFEHFDAIAARSFPWRPIPAEFGVEGYFSRYEKHFVYWKNPWRRRRWHRHRAASAHAPV